MANYRAGVRTICPYYLHEANKSITCEGIAKGTRVMTRFSRAEDKKAYQALNCERYDYDMRCPLAEALSAKYDGDG